MQLKAVVHHQLPQVSGSISDACGTEGVPSNALLCWCGNHRITEW